MRIETMEQLAVGLALEIESKRAPAQESLKERASYLFELHELLMSELLAENARRYARTEAIQKPAESEPA